MCQILYVRADRRLESKEFEQLGKIGEPFERIKKMLFTIMGYISAMSNDHVKELDIETIEKTAFLESWGERWTNLKDLLSFHYDQREKCLALIKKFVRKNLTNTLEEVRIRKRIEVMRIALLLKSSVILRRGVKY